MNKKYTCMVCNDTFTSTVSNDEARANAIRVGTVEPDDAEADLDVVCDNCHAKFMVWFNGLSEADKAAIRAESKGAG